MFDQIRSHTYKLVKTPIFWLMFLWPILVVGLFIAYYSVTAWSLEQKMSGYFQVISLGMPCLVTLLCTYVVQEEEKAGACFNLLCIGKSRIRTFFSVFLLLALMTTIGMVLASVGFYLFWGRMTFMSYVLTTSLMLIPLACLLLIQLFLALKFGRSWSVAVGAIFLLIGALGVTGLLDQFWYYLPPVWAPRFTSLMIADVFHPDWIIPITTELRYGLLICFLFTIIVALLIPGWFHKWDGRPCVGDE